MRTVREYLLDATRSIEEQNFHHAVWLIENAYCLLGEGKYEKELRQISSLINQDSFLIASQDIRESLRRANFILQYNANIMPEEWIMILTEISTAYSFTRFSNRRNWRLELEELDELMESLRSISNDFQDSSIKSRIKGMRRNNPNPLPAPLCELR